MFHEGYRFLPLLRIIAVTPLNDGDENPFFTSQCLRTFGNFFEIFLFFLCGANFPLRQTKLSSFRRRGTLQLGQSFVCFPSEWRWLGQCCQMQADSKGIALPGVHHIDQFGRDHLRCQSFRTDSEF